MKTKYIWLLLLFPMITLGYEINDYKVISDKDVNYSTLVDPWNRVSTSYVPSNLVKIQDYWLKSCWGSDMYYDKEWTYYLEKLIKKCWDETWTYACLKSWYRSYNYQKSLFGNNWYARWIMVPWWSEHQLGLAVDINISSKIYQCLDSYALDYWFIQSYPKWNKYIAWYEIEEPWHWRYIGQEWKLIFKKYWNKMDPQDFYKNYQKYKEQYVMTQQVSSISQCLDYWNKWEDKYIKYTEWLGLNNYWCIRNKKLWKEIVKVLSRTYDYKEETLEKFFNNDYSKYKVAIIIWLKLNSVWAFDTINEGSWFNNINNDKVKTVIRKLAWVWVIKRMEKFYDRDITLGEFSKMITDWQKVYIKYKFNKLSKVNKEYGW